MKRRKTTSEMTALEILKVAAGYADVEPLVDYLLRSGKHLTPAEHSEAWSIVAARKGLEDACAETTAIEHKRAAVAESIVLQPTLGPMSTATTTRFARVVAKFSQQTTMSSYEDCYQDLRLRLLLPVASTVFAVGYTPYRAAANFWGEETNSMVRPLVQTPLKEILADPPPDGTDGDDAWFCAAIVVLKEITNGLPVVSVGPSMIGARSDVPSIAVDRGCFGNSSVRGVLSNDAFTPSVHTLCAWLAAASDHTNVAALAALVLEGNSGGPLDRLLS